MKIKNRKKPSEKKRKMETRTQVKSIWDDPEFAELAMKYLYLTEKLYPNGFQNHGGH